MHKLYDNLLIFAVLVGLPGTQVYAAIEPGLQPPLHYQQELAHQVPSTPREFCRSSGGAVSETRFKSVYLCCYKAKSKCIVTDTQQTVSWPIPYSHRNKQAQLPMQHK